MVSLGKAGACDLTNRGGDSRFNWRCNLADPKGRTAELGTFCIDKGQLEFRLLRFLTGPAAQLHNCALRIVAFDKEKIVFLRKCQEVQSPKPCLLTDSDRKFCIAHSPQYSVSNLPAKPDLVIHGIELTSVNGKDNFDKQAKDGRNCR